MESLPDRLPLTTRLIRFFGRVPDRVLGHHEWISRLTEGGQGIEVLLFAARRPLSMECFVPADLSIRITGVSYEIDGVLTPQEIAVHETPPKDAERRFVIEPFELTRTSRVVIHVSTTGQIEGRLVLRAVREREADLEIAEEALALARLGRLQDAALKLQEYEAYSTENPFVCGLLAEWHQKCGELDAAADYVGRALRWGDPDYCRELYRSIRADLRTTSADGIRDLQSAATEWLGESHVGAVVLERVQRFSVGLNGGQLQRTQETLEIRDATAARMLRRLHFSFSSRRNFVLDTHLEVVRPSGEVETIPLEQFTIGDDRASDVFITVEGQKVGHWILPDLDVGDVVRWTYDLYHGGPTVDGVPQDFALTPLFHDFYPTLKATADFVVPADESIRFAVRNLDEEHDVRRQGQSLVHSFTGNRFVPAKGTGFRYENFHLNPVVACASDCLDWAAVARQTVRSNFGHARFDEEVPEPLATLVREASSPSEALEAAFYWARDKLKYAAVRSGEERIGAEDRAHRIVEAGIGDCKDKSYLLALVCRELKLPHELILVSMKNGIVIEELPADQFDHVFLRARTAEGWTYLDAASSSATYGPAPVWCQGLSALRLTADADIITIPTSTPDANLMRFEEVFDQWEHDRLSGRFRLTAKGHPARFIDEGWKGLSLTFEDKTRGGQVALRQFLPSAVLEDLDRRSDTSASGEFDVEGRHRRGTLVHLPGSELAVCTLTWDVPFLPIDYWTMLESDRLFALHMAATLSVVAKFEGRLRDAVRDVSRVEDLDNRIGSVSETVLEEADAITVRRTVELKHRFFRDEDVALVPETFERIEKALQLVLVYDPAAL